mmetsp:Transcript_95200/g.188597  ORF Transcript_95200/g.188597 Transcript_95200/m.188597 type:complete len:553 (-) Transcript_95200:133-1791(-)
MKTPAVCIFVLIVVLPPVATDARGHLNTARSDVTRYATVPKSAPGAISGLQTSSSGHVDAGSMAAIESSAPRKLEEEFANMERSQLIARIKDLMTQINETNATVKALKAQINQTNAKPQPSTINDTSAHREDSNMTRSQADIASNASENASGKSLPMCWADTTIPHHIASIEHVTGWSWQAYAFLGSISFFCICSQCACCIYCTFITPQSVANDVAETWTSGNVLWGYLAGYSQLNDMLAIGLLLRREMRFRIFTPVLLPLVSWPWSTCNDGTPWWTYAALVPIVCRAKYFEWWILKRLTKNPIAAICSWSFLLGAVDHVDWFLDGMFQVQAIKCDEAVTPIFLAELQNSVFCPLAPIMIYMRFCGLTVLSMLAGTFVLQMLGSMGTGVANLEACADVACFGAVSDHYRLLGHESEGGIVKVLITFLKVALKNSFQLWLQATFFGLAYNELTATGKAKLGISILFGIVGVVFKTRLAAVVTCSQFMAACRFRRKDLACIVVFIWSVQLTSVWLAIWSLLKIYRSWTCPDHLWNIIAGCIEKPYVPYYLKPEY